MPYFDLTIYGAEWALLVLRVSLAAVFLVHGLQKWALWKAQQSEQMPSWQLQLMRLLSIVEPLAGIGLLIGLYTFFAALALAIVMVGALYFKIALWKKKFSESGGWEYDLVLFAALLLLASLGPGVFSIAYP